jgi:hypothetical protein
MLTHRRPLNLQRKRGEHKLLVGQQGEMLGLQSVLSKLLLSF